MSASVERVSPLPGQALRIVGDWEGYDSSVSLVDTDDLERADVITSQVAGPAGILGDLHKVVLDIDFPAQLIPSSTPGHFHLLIDVEMAWGNYADMLEAMRDAGILEEGYVSASIARGFTAVRLPWVKKEDAAPQPRCVGCRRKASQIDEYVTLAKDEGLTSAAEAVRREEGTFNRKNGHFYCTKCYIAAGQPLGVAP